MEGKTTRTAIVADPAVPHQRACVRAYIDTRDILYASANVLLLLLCTSVLANSRRRLCTKLYRSFKCGPSRGPESVDRPTNFLENINTRREIYSYSGRRLREGRTQLIEFDRVRAPDRNTNNSYGPYRVSEAKRRTTYFNIDVCPEFRVKFYRFYGTDVTRR